VFQFSTKQKETNNNKLTMSYVACLIAVYVNY